jgi:UDP-glucose 4-epimerase
MSHYLITGGAGFIGSHLVELLLQEGHRVTVIDDFSTGRRENLPSQRELSVVATDLLKVTCDQLAGPFDAIVHLAALPSVNDSWTDVMAAHQLNLTATVRVLELASAMRILKIVYASSAAVYGNPDSIPIVEEHLTLPLSPYGLQKLASEQYGRLFAQNQTLSFVALRFFNVFGPRQVATSPYSGVISKFASAMRAGQPIKIHGDGKQTRDFVYVTDIARGIAQALEMAGLESYIVCNLGTGRAVSIRELAETMRAIFPDWKGSFQAAPAPPGDIVHSQASIAAAGRLLGFRPAYSLESGLVSMMQLAGHH